MNNERFLSINSVFEELEIPDSERPTDLRIEQNGFLGDDSFLYGFRRARFDSPSPTIEDLYNGSLKPDGRRSSFQATEGHGLYIANSPAATKVPGIKGDNMYAVRIEKRSLRELDSLHPDSVERGQRLAANLHRIRGTMIGIPNPGVTAWDRLYGDSDLVTFPPMAIARLILGYNIQLGDQAIKPRWAIIRNLDKAEVLPRNNIKD